jgi:hypothetical protein
MMCRKGFGRLLFALLIAAGGCVPVSQPALGPVLPEDAALCCDLFPRHPWESVHRIEATLRGGRSSSLLGITKGEPSERRVESLLLTPEGFILFHAERREDQLSVRRAVAPFDSRSFAGGLMDDVGLLFLFPGGKLTTGSKKSDGTMMCRWRRPDGSSVEITGSVHAGWLILGRAKNGNINREAFLKPPFLNGLASYMDLRASRPASYRLRMTLLEAAP